MVYFLKKKPRKFQMATVYNSRYWFNTLDTEYRGTEEWDAQKGKLKSVKSEVIKYDMYNVYLENNIKIMKLTKIGYELIIIKIILRDALYLKLK